MRAVETWQLCHGCVVFVQVIATADILEGDELCFSYGERSNDDFFVHYGFVPLRNPRDEVILFESIESALDWCAPPLTCSAS